MNYASPFWHQVLIASAVIYLLFEIWRGWRKGVVRMALTLVALAGASMAFVLVFQISSSLLANVMPVASVFAAGFLGLVAAIAVYVIVWFVSALLFKRTGHHSSGIVKFFFGIGGAVLGAVFGLVILVSVISCIRLFGTLGESYIGASSRLAGGAGGNSAVSSAVNGGPLQSIATGFATLKQSMGVGPAGKTFQAVDVIPQEGYDLVSKIGKLGSDENAIARFMDYPGTKELMNDPRIVALSKNPDVVNAIQGGNYMGLLQNKDLLAAVNDPELLARLEKFNLEGALDYALAKPGQTPVNSTNPNP